MTKCQLKECIVFSVQIPLINLWKCTMEQAAKSVEGFRLNALINKFVSNDQKDFGNQKSL